MRGSCRGAGIRTWAIYLHARKLGAGCCFLATTRGARWRGGGSAFSHCARRLLSYFPSPPNNKAQ
ncbi:hypothetical protein PR003_g17597 [Phytophthora rubi]|uniref:Uncharacterized protein n=1 Tax=Phytophthora rubi TaxID=129364 RepID=A0A6A3J3E6_9STRA|nr:hypothetical protein PR002_g21561 [Phytophthora rubi]KAE8992326.1 hypothetical protein PR001_g20972 [Phytophthora rubi]KAE9320890.1 hypothetical protein PR003_g17597 [Phytophthora rubi]